MSPLTGDMEGLRLSNRCSTLGAAGGPGTEQELQERYVADLYKGYTSHCCRVYKQ